LPCCAEVAQARGSSVSAYTGRTTTADTFPTRRLRDAAATFVRPLRGYGAYVSDPTRPTSVLLLLKEYPQISQTYIKHEIEAVENDYDLTIVTRKGPDIPYVNHRPHRTAEHPDELREIVEEVRPEIIHTHYLVELPTVGRLAQETGVPFTVRAHSFDTLALRRKGMKGRLKQRLKRTPPLERTPWFQEGLRHMRDELCLGVLTFPFTRPWLERVDAPSDKLIDCWPVVNVQAFLDDGPNGDGVMNTGVTTPKKKMTDFVDLGAVVPDVPFRLYGMGYEIDDLREYNRERGNPVEFVDPVQPEEMPAAYKQHRWLVYTADFDVPTVGWPMAVAEAQASGVGVCMPRIRPDLAAYVGPGVLYDSIEDVADVVSGPVPDAMRAAGFEHARRSDIHEHKQQLTDLWDRAVA
jgi:hypothetical protein